MSGSYVSGPIYMADGRQVSIRVVDENGNGKIDTGDKVTISTTSKDGKVTSTSVDGDTFRKRGEYEIYRKMVTLPTSKPNIKRETTSGGKRGLSSEQKKAITRELRTINAAVVDAVGGSGPEAKQTISTGEKQKTAPTHVKKTIATNDLTKITAATNGAVKVDAQPRAWGRVASDESYVDRDTGIRIHPRGLPSKLPWDTDSNNNWPH